MTLSTKLRVDCNATQTLVRDTGTASIPHAVSTTIAYASGTAAGQADVIYSDTNTLAASGTSTLDLAGVLSDLGTTLTFVKVKAIVITAAAGNTNNVILGGAASNGFVSWVGGATHTVTIRPGGFFALGVGAGDLNAYAVTAGTADQLLITNSAGSTSVTYTIAIIGTSA
jgi:hypothetical protein